MDDVLDETYTRFARTGPEFEGWLSNHGPMAADALVRLGRAESVEGWADSYLPRLDEPPGPRWTLEEDEWRDVLGDPSRLGDWCRFFAGQLDREPWTDLLGRWWPRLLPGAVASATHGLIRTGHAVRALRERQTPERLAELGQGLAYWAARWQPLPGAPGPQGIEPPATALEGIEHSALDGGMRARLRALSASSTWPASMARLRPVTDPREVRGELLDLVDRAVGSYAAWGHGNPVMLVHAATAPRAVALVLPSLSEDLWVPSYDVAWGVTAAVTAAYRPADARRAEPSEHTVEDLVDRAVASRDEHAIKFAEVAVESHRRGNSLALPAVGRAVELIGG